MLYKYRSSFHNEFSVNSQLLLLINFLIFAALLLYFFSGRSRQSGRSMLDLARKNSQEEISSPPAPGEPVTLQPASEPQPEVIEVASKPVKSAKFDKKEIVYFVYNGHEWEAHEVLGLKSGGTLEEATRHYQDLIKSSDPSTFEFYEAAFSAILKLKRPKW